MSLLVSPLVLPISSWPAHCLIDSKVPRIWTSTSLSAMSALPCRLVLLLLIFLKTCGSQDCIWKTRLWNIPVWLCYYLWGRMVIGNQETSQSGLLKRCCRLLGAIWMLCLNALKSWGLTFWEVHNYMSFLQNIIHKLLDIINLNYQIIVLLNYPDYLLSDYFYYELAIDHLSSMLLTRLTLVSALKAVHQNRKCCCSHDACDYYTHVCSNDCCIPRRSALAAE